MATIYPLWQGYLDSTMLSQREFIHLQRLPGPASLHCIIAISENYFLNTSTFWCVFTSFLVGMHFPTLNIAVPQEFNRTASL